MAYDDMKAKEVSKKKTFSYEKESTRKKPYFYEKEQPKKKTYSYEKEATRKKEYSYEKDFKKAAKSMKKSAIAWVVVILFLILGVVGGFFAHKLAFKDDVYQMVTYANGQADVYIGSDEELQTYTELGVKCISFGKEVSNECTVKYYYRADLTQDQVEVSEVDETKPGIYYAVYSNTSKKYKSVTLIRNIIVLGEEG